MALNDSSIVGQGLKNNNFNSETLESIQLNSKSKDAVSTVESLKDRLLMSAPVVAEKVQTLDPESLSVWTAALASNDIKGVEVLSHPDQAASFAKNGMMKADLERISVDQKQAEGIMPKGEKSDFSANELGSHKWISERTHLQAQAKSEVVETKLPSSKNDGNQTPLSKEEGFKVSPHHKASLSNKEFSMDQKSKSASDFMLARMNGSGNAVKIEKFESPFIQPESIGLSQDKRISAEAMNFVGQKVQDLKAIGGGEIKIDLHPKDLGQLEIRVGMNRGKMEVTIEAEKPETLSALQNSSEQLKGKLNLIASSELKLLSKVPEKAILAQDHSVQSGTSPKLASVGSSQDMMGLRMGSATQKGQVSKQNFETFAPLSQSQAIDAPSFGSEDMGRPEILRTPDFEVRANGESRSSDFSKEEKSDTWKRWEEYQKRKSA